MEDRLFQPGKYPNLLPKIRLSSEDIIEQISGYRLEFFQIHNDYVEWRLRLPPFISSFYDYILSFKSVPKQSEAYDYYRF